MNEYEDLSRSDPDTDLELDAWLASADRAVLSAVEGGIDLVGGLAAITGREHAEEEPGGEPTPPEPDAGFQQAQGRSQRHRRRRNKGATSDSSTLHFGHVVNMHGGHCNTGIVNYHSAPQGPDRVSAAVELAALRELVHQVQELAAGIPSLAPAVEILPVISDASLPAPELRRALLTIVGVAAAAGAVGQPVLEAAGRLLELLEGA
ncbi:hypothetical protein [Streptomyces sp. NPDC002054]|uniref:hypothetical protein n=1 Tax=Streptomyces sp. NPDC002054 TaxID=3154663 RepID=UPI00332D496F